MLIAQDKADIILRVLADRMDFQAPATVEDAPAATTRTKAAHWAAMKSQGFARDDSGFWIRDGLAVVPVIGTLVQRGGHIGYSGMTSYDAIESMIGTAHAAGNVDRVLLEIDSPGGEVAGAFDLADRIRALNQDKPVTAVASELAASAGYLLASAAGEVVVARSGYTGSIGVVTAHMDASAELEKKGRAVTLIYAGKHKVDGNPYQALAKDVQARIQADVDRLYTLFVDSVARYRGLDAQAIRDTEAAVFMGEQALEHSLVDRVGSFSAELERARTQRTSRRVFSSPSMESPMDEEQKPALVATQAQLDQAKATAHAEGIKAGAKAERTRINAILGHEAAEGRSDMASHMAFETDMTAEAATALLAKAPKAGATGGGLAAAMAAAGTAGVTDADDSTGAELDAPVIDAQAIYKSRNAAARGAAH